MKINHLDLSNPYVIGGIIIILIIFGYFIFGNKKPHKQTKITTNNVKKNQYNTTIEGNQINFNTDKKND